MSQTLFVAAVAGAWVAIGVALSLVMARRGHNGFGWGVLGAVMGPLAVVLAVLAAHDERAQPRRVVRAGSPGPGPVDVVVAVDDSPESAAAVAAAVELLGSRLGRLTLATVVDYDVPDGARPGEAERWARAMLARQAAAVPVARDPRAEVLVGSPADALTRLTAEGGYDLLAIGTRGRGRSKILLGSVATRLATRTKVPVLLVGSR